MKVKILKTTVASGKNLKAGSTPDISEKDARFLIALGKAEAYKTPKKAPKKAPVDRSLSSEDIETK